MMQKKYIFMLLALAPFLFIACGKSEIKTEAAVKMDAPALEKAAVEGNPNSIEISPEVQRNLGMTFATAERRVVEGVYRIPGHFELRPDAMHEYHTMLEGRIALHVKQFDRVVAGDLLATLDSPSWRQLQHSAVEAEGEIRVMEAGVEVARARLEELEKSIAFHAQRIENLQAANVRQISLEAELAEMRNQKPRLAAELNASEVNLTEAQEHYFSRIRTMSSVTGLSREALLATVEIGGVESAVWNSLDKLEIRAEADGVVDTIDATNGAWAETGAHILATVDTNAIRFSAQAPQSELPLFKDGQAARITPPSGGSIGNEEAMPAIVHVGSIARADERVIPLHADAAQLAPWARPGISGYLELITGDAKAQLSIPETALVRDELELVFFKRNPKNKNEALKVKADLGKSDGKWVVVKSGVTDGEEVVVEGAYALKLAGSKSTAPEGYHYHADGSLHKDH